MKLFIDNKEVDTDGGTLLSVSLSIASITTPEYARTGYSKSITIPATPHNRDVMGDCEQIHARDRFNDRLHTARVESGGFTVMEGTIMLTGCERRPGGAGGYTFNIIGSGKLWAQHASAYGFSTLFPDWNMTINAQTIRESWTTEGSPVRFLPVQRDVYELTNSSVSLMPAERVLTASDYHPFINLRAAVEAIFAAAGYSVESEFMSGEWFGSLYMSGNYSSRDVSALRSRMDFLAGRFAAAGTVADTDGRVYANPYLYYNTIGNLVDTADPKEDRNGLTLDDVFTNNGCFCMDGSRVMFKPLYELTLGFEYTLRYVTGYKIRSSAELTGFNTLYLGNGDLRSFSITNRFADRRNEFRAGKVFRCFVSGYTTGYIYQLYAWRITNDAADPENLQAGDYENVLLGSFSAKSGLVSTLTEGKYTNLRLYYYAKLGVETLYKGDWALYDGSVTESGQTEVEVTVRGKAQTVTPSKPKYFDDFYFGGAESGMNFNLLEATVRPVFSPHPSEGSTVSFAEVAAHGVSRLEVINALRQMFNLCFYTDNVENKVYIEPRNGFFVDGEVDWSDRVDMSKPFVVKELGADMARTLIFRYRGGDGAVERFNASGGGPLGQWSAEVVNPYASCDNRVFENALFTPSVNTTQVLPSALSASWLQAGDRDTNGDVYSDDLNFPPKVVRYAGMETLPSGERWGWPSFGTEYPATAFHSEGDPDGLTLCFEDRDGCLGLHRFWDRNIDMYNRGRSLEVWLRLEPSDVEPFIEPNRLRRDFRARFRLRINGETGYWRLEEICDYTPGAASTKCVFVKDI